MQKSLSFLSETRREALRTLIDAMCNGFIYYIVMMMTIASFTMGLYTLGCLLLGVLMFKIYMAITNRKRIRNLEESLKNLFTALAKDKPVTA